MHNVQAVVTQRRPTTKQSPPITRQTSVSVYRANHELHFKKVHFESILQDERRRRGGGDIFSNFHNFFLRVT